MESKNAARSKQNTFKSPQVFDGGLKLYIGSRRKGEPVSGTR